MTSDEQKSEVDRIKRHVNELMEHFDTVHIFVTRNEEGALGATVNIQLGAGNWFARYGQVRTWLVKEDEVARLSQRKDEEGL